jgi:hypothetical protein
VERGRSGPGAFEAGGFGVVPCEEWGKEEASVIRI